MPLEPAPARASRWASLGLASSQQRAWAMYDWANSAFTTTVLTAVYPIYFAAGAAAAGLAREQATARFALVTALALGLCAVLSPPLGVLADRRPLKKALLAGFTALGSAATLGLALAPPQAWRLGLALFALANIGAAAAFVFYDALLPHVAAPDEIDRTSTAGYALGYVGGGVLLAVNLLWIERPAWFGLADAAAASRLSFASVALWWALFTLPLLRRVPEPPVVVRSAPSVRELWRELRARPQALLFLLAFLIYNDGIGTIIRLATIYGSGIGIGAGDLIGAVLLVQFLGIPATFAFGALAARVGPVSGIFAALAVYTAVSAVAYFMQTAAHFYALAALVGLVQGGAQALSRSLFASLIPASRSAEFFALFSVCEKFAAIAGPALFSAALYWTGSSRSALLSVALFFAVGAALLSRVDVEAGRRAAREGAA